MPTITALVFRLLFSGWIKKGFLNLRTELPNHTSQIGFPGSSETSALSLVPLVMPLHLQDIRRHTLLFFHAFESISTLMILPLVTKQELETSSP